jgi:hypothetical protein
MLEECTAGVIYAKHSAREFVNKHLVGEDGRSYVDSGIYWQHSNREEFEGLATLKSADLNATLDFELGLDCPFLCQIEIADTPGYDGTGYESNLRAMNAIERATIWADLSLLVLQYKGLTMGDTEIAQLLFKHCSEIVIVCNKSDLFDLEESRAAAEHSIAGWKEVFSASKSIGVSIPQLFTISSLWEGSTPGQRAEIVKNRLRKDFSPQPLHEWSELCSLLTSRYRTRSAFELWSAVLQTCNLRTQYSIVKQAERVLTEPTPLLRDRLKGGIGPQLLALATNHAKRQETKSWIDIMARQSLTPLDLAPVFFLSLDLIPSLVLELLALVESVISVALPRNDWFSLERIGTIVIRLPDVIDADLSEDLNAWRSSLILNQHLVASHDREWLLTTRWDQMPEEKRNLDLIALLDCLRRTKRTLLRAKRTA